MALEQRNLSWLAVAAISCVLFLALAMLLLIPNYRNPQDLLVQKSTTTKASAPIQKSELETEIERGHFGLLGHSDGKALPFFPYESISLERTACLGPCPIYVVTFFNDGHATLVTENYGEKKKSYTGEGGLLLYARLTQLVDLARPAAKEADYVAQWTDDYTAIIRVKSKNGVWRVSDYGEVAPPEVWALETLLHIYREKVEWKLVSEAPRNQS